MVDAPIVVETLVNGFFDAHAVLLSALSPVDLPNVVSLYIILDDTSLAFISISSCKVVNISVSKASWN